MNKIILITDNKTTLKHFSSIEKSSKWNFESATPELFRKILKTPDPDTLYILDYESAAEDKRAKDLKYLLGKTEVPRAVIDRKKNLDDPAELLMTGCDYIGPSLLRDGIKSARITKYLDFFNSPGKEEAPVRKSTTQKSNNDYIPSPNGWQDIRSGKKYTFYMLFTEISIPSDWKKNSGNVHLNQLKQIFQNVADKIATRYNGKVWIWNEYGGLILFPYDGETDGAVTTGIKLMMNRVLISIEDFQLHTPINFKTAIHLGTTTWKARGKTGTIISDSLNSIFHLGTKYTPLNDMDITEEVYKELPEGMKNMFSSAGNFEDRNIFRLCHFEFVS